MPIYICLMKLTEQGKKDIKDAPERLENATKSIEAMGGKLVDFYLVMGEYDYVSVAEFPNDEVGMTFLLGLGAAGNLGTTTLKAFSIEEFAEMTKKLP